MIRKIVYIVSLLAFSAGPCIAGGIRSDDGAVGYFEPVNVLRFADHLFESGDYLRAAGEYRRYLFQMNHSAGTDSVFYRMAKSVFLGEDYGLSEKLLGDLARLYPHSPVAADISLHTAVVRYAMGDYEGALGLLAGGRDSGRGIARVVASMSCFHLGDPGSAKRWSCGGPVFPRSISMPVREALIDDLAYLCREAGSAASLPHRSRFLAGAMSALLPGTGKIYCGRFTDGLYAFLTVGLLAWGAYDGFDEDGRDSTKGWVFGVLGGGFYLGNIYGSSVTAGIYNKRAYDVFLRGLTVEITLP